MSVQYPMIEPFGPEDYVLNLKGSTYFADRNNRTGVTRVNPNGDFIDLIDALNAENPDGMACKLGRGTFECTDTFEMQTPTTKYKGLGSGASIVKLGDSVNKPVIAWKNDAFYWDILLEDFSIDGNRTQNTTADLDGILAKVTETTIPGGNGEKYHTFYTLRNLRIYEVNGHGWHHETTTGTDSFVVVDNCEIQDNGDGATKTVDVYVKRFFDSWIIGGGFAAIEIDSGFTTNHWLHTYLRGGAEKIVCYWHGGTQAFPCRGNIIDGVRFDNPKNSGDAESACMLMDDFNYFNWFKDCAWTHPSIVGTTTNISPAMQIQGDSLRNTFEGYWGHRRYDAVTDKFKWAILELENADYNIYKGEISRKDIQGNDVFGTGYWSKAPNSDVSGLIVI